MTDYVPPLRDMQFCLHEMGVIDRLRKLSAFENLGNDVIDAVLEGSGTFAREVLAPINHTADIEGASISDGVVSTPDGFAEAYQKFVDGGWASLPFNPVYGGQNLPWVLAAATQEMWISANTSWSLCQILTTGAVELLSEHGTDEQKSLYLGKLISGSWSGTMNLTEPHAGSDLGKLSCKAIPAGDHYNIQGQKIYITYGDHDMADNIIHFVLARTPEANSGPKGISLFIVPKVLVNPDGTLGALNDLRCLSLEKKLGINASPTCVMSYGDNDGAVGYLVGEEGRGLNAMFTMMNNARLNIGISGLAIAERAYQQARDYAKERHQFGPIVKHPDIRRMLMTMKAQIEAMRAVIFDAALALDYAKKSPGIAQQARINLLIPMVKAWCADLGVEITSLALQIHGGAGFMESTGVAQHFRDARIAPIYEGTNGIQSIDLISRKVLRDKGTAMFAWINDARETIKNGAKNDVGQATQQGLDHLAELTDWMLENSVTTVNPALAGANAYLRIFGVVAGGVQLNNATELANQPRYKTSAFHNAKLITAKFYSSHILPQISGLRQTIEYGHEEVMTLPDTSF